MFQGHPSSAASEYVLRRSHMGAQGRSLYHHLGCKQECRASYRGPHSATFCRLGLLATHCATRHLPPSCQQMPLCRWASNYRCQPVFRQGGSIPSRPMSRHQGRAGGCEHALEVASHCCTAHSWHRSWCGGCCVE
jgi:hypothetical protein